LLEGIETSRKGFIDEGILMGGEKRERREGI